MNDWPEWLDEPREQEREIGLELIALYEQNDELMKFWGTEAWHPYDIAQLVYQLPHRFSEETVKRLKEIWSRAMKGTPYEQDPGRYLLQGSEPFVEEDMFGSVDAEEKAD